jgi:hypothetical protein
LLRIGAAELRNSSRSSLRLSIQPASDAVTAASRRRESNTVTTVRSASRLHPHPRRRWFTEEPGNAPSVIVCLARLRARVRPRRPTPRRLVPAARTAVTDLAADANKSYAIGPQMKLNSIKAGFFSQ